MPGMQKDDLEFEEGGEMTLAQSNRLETNREYIAHIAENILVLGSECPEFEGELNQCAILMQRAYEMLERVMAPAGR